jgi:putative phosphoesterase
MKVAFISDIHSNLEALETVVKEIDKLNVEKIFCVGDVIGYGANPNECLNVIKNKRIPCVMGNHEEAVILKDTSNFNVYAAEAIEWTIHRITKDNLKFIKSFPEKLGIDVDGFKVLVVHGSPFDPINEYVYPDYPLERIVDAVDVDVIVMGHTHVPFVKEVKGCLVINSGSVGQPRDRNPGACYLILDILERKAEIFRAKYDIKKAAEKIIKAGLPEILAQRLFLGV